jgi:hypothetical protein
MKLTIIGKTYVNDTDKAGNPLTYQNKKGETVPYKKIAFKVKEEVCGKMGEYINGFYQDSMAGWTDGTEIEVDVELKDGKYLNFKLPSKSVSRAEFDVLKERVNKLWERVMDTTQEDIPIYEGEG